MLRLNKAKLSSTVVLGGKAGEVKATDCEITGKVVKIHNSTLVTSGSTSTGGSTGGSSGGSSGGGSSAPAAPSAYPLPNGQETSKSLGVFNYDMTYFVTLTAQDGADIYYEVAEGADKAAVPTTASKSLKPTSTARSRSPSRPQARKVRSSRPITSRRSRCRTAGPAVLQTGIMMLPAFRTTS